MFCSKPSLDICARKVFLELKKLIKSENIEFLDINEKATLENLYFLNLKDALESLRRKLKFKNIEDLWNALWEKTKEATKDELKFPPYEHEIWRKQELKLLKECLKNSYLNAYSSFFEKIKKFITRKCDLLIDLQCRSLDDFKFVAELGRGYAIRRGLEEFILMEYYIGVSRNLDIKLHKAFAIAQRTVNIPCFPKSERYPEKWNRKYVSILIVVPYKPLKGKLFPFFNLHRQNRFRGEPVCRKEFVERCVNFMKSFLVVLERN